MKTLIAAVLVGVGLLTPTFAYAKTSTKPVADWTELARKVGISEELRDRNLREIKRIPNLKAKLRAALKTSKRKLALEAIGALEMTSLVPDMVEMLPSDKNGFLTLAVNGMMTPENQDRTLKRYLELLLKASVPAQLAMLEPLGRLNVKIPRTTLDILATAESPDTRAGILYYVRIMALRHRNFENVDIVQTMMKARESQLRLQAESIQQELRAPRVAVAGP